MGYKLSPRHPEKLLEFRLECLEHIDSAKINVHTCGIADTYGTVRLNLNFPFNSRIFGNHAILLTLTQQDLVIVMTINVFLRYDI